jgi:hypothetical protein
VPSRTTLSVLLYPLRWLRNTSLSSRLRREVLTLASLRLTARATLSTRKERTVFLSLKKEEPLMETSRLTSIYPMPFLRERNS